MAQQSIVNVLIPAAATIVGVIIGYVLSSLSRWRDKRKMLRNIKMVLLKEMKENCRELVKLTPFRGPHRANAEMVADTLSMLSTSVYDKYLDQLCGLKEEELARVYHAYFWTKYDIEQGRKYINGDIVSTEILFTFCDQLLYLIYCAIVLLDDGEKSLYNLEEELERRDSERLEGYFGWLDKVGNKAHPLAKRGDRDHPST